MLLEIKSKERARVLELEGYSRNGSKAFIVDGDEITELIDDKATSISKIVFDRHKSDEAANVIDECLKLGLSGKYPAYTIRAKDYTGPKIKVGKNRGAFDLEHDQLTVTKRFDRFWNGGERFPVYPSEARVEEVLGQHADNIESDIEELEAKIEELEDEVTDIDQRARHMREGTLTAEDVVERFR